MIWAVKVPVDNIDINLKKEKDNNIKMLWEIHFYPIFDNLMSNQSWLSQIEEELTWSEDSSKKSIEKSLSQKIIIIESNSKEETDKKREIIVIDDRDEDND